MRYLPHTPQEIEAMLATIGAANLDALFESVPKSHRLNRPLALEPALDEVRLMEHLQTLAARNPASAMVSFLGAGMYDHHIPPAVDQLLMRSEFYTAYTPYQAEVAQGTLQAMFEFQTMVCELLDMPVANGSMYDGASATAEAVLMARRVTGKQHIVLSEGLHPEYVQTVHTYLHNLDEGRPAVTIAPLDASGQTDARALQAALRDDTAAVVVGYPNVFGCVEDLGRMREVCRQKGALLITATNEPYALSLIQPPGAFEVDIAVGEGQALAVPPQFGGPGVGLFATRQEYVQKMPGRLVGETVDAEGKRGFVLTLSTREQHIRRERATSNICTNHGLIALAFTIRAAMLGKSGFVHVGRTCFQNAEYLKARLLATGKFTLPFSSPTFNEFVVRSTSASAQALVDAAARKNLLAGVPLARFYPERTHDLLIAVTEKHREEHLDALVDALVDAG
jgi:glycine dehydrogenase subunit 1